MDEADSVGSVPSEDESASICSEPSDELTNLADVPENARDSRDEEPEYEMLSPDQLSQHMADITQEVAQIIQVPPTYLRLLLAYFKWDKHAFTEFYFENDKARTFAQAGLVDPASFSDDSHTFNSTQVSKSEPFCDICCMNFPHDQMQGLACRHYFCLACWQRYLEWKIMEESQGDRIYCPSYGCNVLIEDESVFRVITNPNVRRRFQKLISNSFVMHNRSLTWCPGADCGYAARCLGPEEPRQINCTNCSESFCFACSQPWHDPVRCDQLKNWLKRVSDDSGTSNWIVANTKECPKCHATIEKSGGCNHMICRNVDCKFEFCWLCLDRWEPHGAGWYKCNRYNEDTAKKARDAQAQSRRNLDRYLFYFNRYFSHLQSLRFEARLYESVQEKMDAMQNSGTSWIDVKFIRKVVDVLCSCRRTLMYTYVFAFFLKKNNHSILFERNQSDLELSTEYLSGLLDRDLCTTSLNELKQKLQDKARYCASRRRVLLEHVDEGYKEGIWEPYDP
ncbi:hypothetical protein CRM22_007182 [Opisthorchis felineus]|uniref:RBR-type E3 ubiquitin transferase n=1 Tax=Opisthorchis felineus TaxID=147828 RepID=A0A4S2LNZ4_OPIFE|nr:hypothetical protein CRM22_007182 [Opisthorchis felineus]